MALDAAYRAFVASQAGATVWHDADLLLALVSPARREQMDYAAVFERDRLGQERMVAVLPFCRKARLDGWVITMPPLMRYCGPLFDAEWLAARGLHAALGEVWAVLPKGYRALDQMWALSPEVLPVYPDWHLHVRRRLTHIAHLAVGVEQLSAAQSKQMRYDLRRAGKVFSVRHSQRLSAEALELLGEPYRRQGMAQPFDGESLGVLFDVFGERQQIVCTEIYNERSVLQACAIILADVTTGYALLTAVAEAARPLSGGSYALYQGVLWAMRRGCERFDFMGSETAGIADSFRRLGGKPASYSRVYEDTVVWTRAWRAWRA